MTNKYNTIINKIIPNKKTNYFIITIFFIGIITGALFANIIGINDRTLIINKIKQLITNIDQNNIISISVFKNSLNINLIYISIIWILGLTFLGILINPIILYLKAFIFSFSLTSFIITYSYKGIILSILYLIFSQLLNLIALIIISIYSIQFGKKIITIIFKNQSNNIKKFLKNYIIILIISIIIAIISALSESFIFPAIIKLIIKLYL